MVQTIVIENQTAKRANVIAQRTGSIELGIMKSLMIALLKEKMYNGIAHFSYLKKSKNGEKPEVREAWGTLQTALVRAKTNGKGYNKEVDNVVAYFDIEKGAWRSFRYENLIQVF